MKIAVISSAQIAAEPGRPLDAGYWVDRLPGESYAQYRYRQQILKRVALLRRTAARCLKLADEIEQMVSVSLIAPPVDRPGDPS